MKRKLLLLFLLLTMVFAIGCNKENKNPEPTPTPVPTSTPTPTPVPVNLAKDNLEKFLTEYDKLMALDPNSRYDLTKGVGYDMTIDLSVGQQILDLLGVTGLDTIRLNGSVDMKDSISMDMGLFLNSSEIINAVMYMTDNKMILNLPKYSSAYAEESLEEALNEAGYTDLESLNLGNTMQLSAEINNMLRSHLADLIACFKEVDITPKSSIGTGDYVMTGDKHTVTAASKDILVVLKAFEADMEKYYGELDFGLSDLDTSEVPTLYLDYYTDEKGNFAWAYRTDEAPEDQIVLINTNLGFCLYKLEDGVTTPGMTSIKSTENTGVIYLYFNEEELAEGELAEPMGTIDYEYSDNVIHADILVDTIEATLDYSTKNDIIAYELTLVMDGLSFVFEETATKENAKATMTLASYGIKYATIDINMTFRDYMEKSVPTNTVDLETWAAGLDLEALTNDLTQLMTDYPFLAALFGSEEEDDGYDDWEGEEWSDGNETQRTEPFVLPEGYTDDFMHMTGWNVDADGYVDFEPLESEVLAAGKPSTGYDRLAVSEDQTQQLFLIAEKAVKNYEKSSYPYYWVWGSAEYQDIASYYSNSVEFANPDNWDDSVSYIFDAVSGDFIGADIYNPSKDEALRIANEIYKVLGGTYTITDTMAEEGTYDADAGFSFYGYDAAQYGDSYYNISINVYNDDWE
ncbi:MAG: hypothetical protein J6J44_04345 [Lachnospiraceae bacterium]|nr:hypothetical protein [Lachnospiraceae bacterium]